MNKKLNNIKKVTPFFLRWSVFFIGLMVMSLGLSMMIRADLGSAPWDVLHIGLFYQLGLTIGTWSIIVGLFIIGFTSILTKSPPQLGAFLNMLLVGVFIDIYLLFVPFLITPTTMLGKLIMLLVGILVNGYGMGLYISANCGAGPRDSLMLALTERTGWKVQWIRGVMEVVVLLIGWLLGGPIFIGTIIFCFTIGPIVGITLPQCKKVVEGILRRGDWNENIYEGSLRIDNHDGVGKEIR